MVIKKKKLCETDYNYNIAKKEVKEYLSSVLPETVSDFLADVGGTYPIQLVSLKCPSYNADWANDDVDSSATNFNKMVDEITQIIINDYIKDMFN